MCMSSQKDPTKSTGNKSFQLCKNQIFQNDIKIEITLKRAHKFEQSLITPNSTSFLPLSCLQA
jgi:hypothetical protein